MQELDDNALLRAYSDRGSEEAFATLVTRHLNKVYSVALRHTGHPHQAEEITQAVFVILARKSGQLKKPVILEGWLYQTARLTALTSIRGEIRRARREEEAYMQNITDKNEPDEWAQITPLLDTAIAGLNEADRHAVVLRFFYGQSLKEVATALGGSESAATLRVRRALEKLRQFFSQHGVDSTTDVIAGALSVYSVHVAPATLAQSVTALAITKGIAASGSTSTLIKGALTLMAWTKTKIAIVAGVAAILALGTTATLIETSSPDIQGTWIATVVLKKGWGVHAGEAPVVRDVMRITRTNGTYLATIENIDSGIRGLPITRFDLKHHSLYMTVTNEIYEATVNFAGTKISGTVKGNGMLLPVTYRRTTNPPLFPEPLTDVEFAPRTGSELQGYWQGKIGSGNGLRLNVKIAEAVDGTYRADLYVPDQGTNRQPTTVAYDGKTVRVMPMAGYGMFQGELRNNATELVGNWIQNGQLAPTKLTREQ